VVVFDWKLLLRPANLGRYDVSNPLSPLNILRNLHMLRPP